MKKCFIGLLLSVVFMTSGCATRLADMSVIASHNVNLNRMDLDELPQVRNVTGKDSKFIFLIFPFGVPHLEDALDDALQKGDGDIMIDAVVHQTGWWFLIGETGLEVKGTVVKTRGAK